MGSAFKAVSNSNKIDQLFMERNGKIHTRYNGGEWFEFDEIPGTDCSNFDMEINMNGKLEVFAIGSNNKIYHSRQKAPSSYYEWGEWTEMPGNGLAEQIAVGKNADGRLEAFIIGTKGRVYHQWQKYPDSFDEWSGWEELPGKGLARELSVERNADGRLEVFITYFDNSIFSGLDSVIFHNCQTARIMESTIHTDAKVMGPWENFKLIDKGNGWYAIQTRDGYYLTVVDGGGKISDVIHTEARTIGPWEKFKLIDEGNGWYAIQTIEGNYLTAVNGGGRTVDVIHSDATDIGPWEKFKINDQVRGWSTIQTSDGHYLTAVNGGGVTSDLKDGSLWSEWNPLGGKAKQIITTHNKDGRLELFHRGEDHGIYHKWQISPSGDFSSNWKCLGESEGFAKFIASGINKDGRIEVVTVGNDDRIYHFHQTAPNSGWSSQDRLGGFANFAKQLTVGSQSDGTLIVYTIGTNDSIYCFKQNPEGGWNDEESLGGPAVISQPEVTDLN
ncbi:MAG: hypothetical protein ABRQ27_13970 [Clostridiaceae bacterium]